jgi:hypothetical protein
MALAKMNDIYDCIYTRPYAEDDYSINDFVDNLARSLSWYMFEHQDEICYNISEKNPPMLKDNVIERMQNFLDTEFGWVRNYIICRMLISYRMNNVDLGNEAEWYLREEFDDDSWKELNEAINKHVWDDYCKYLGSEKTKAYFENINRPEFIPKEIKES